MKNYLYNLNTKDSMKKTILIIFLLLISSVFAHADEEVKDFSEAKKLVDSKVSCDNLTEEQLEEIGEYIMEQMHTGEAHEQMHESMGLVEGTNEEKQFHVNMTKSMYCQGGMNMAMGMNDMGMNYGGSNMMGYSYGAFGFLWMLLGLVLFVGATILVWLLVVKFWRELKNKKQK